MLRSAMPPQRNKVAEQARFGPFVARPRTLNDPAASERRAHRCEYGVCAAFRRAWDRAESLAGPKALPFHERRMNDRIVGIQNAALLLRHEARAEEARQ